MGLTRKPTRNPVAAEVRGPLAIDLPWNAAQAGDGTPQAGANIRITQNGSARITQAGDQRITR